MKQLYITSAVYQPQSAKRKHIWRSCISTAITKLSESTAGRHGRVDQQYQPRSAKKQHTRCSYISTARCANRDQQGEIIYGTAVFQQRGTSTAISTTEANLAQVYINSNQLLKAKPFWTTQPYRPERYINRDQQQKTYLARLYVTSAE